MDVKYPLNFSWTQHSALYGKITQITTLKFRDQHGMEVHVSGSSDEGARRFFDQLVADANDAATIKADYERLGTKIDDMVEARTATSLKELTAMQERSISQLESAAFVDAKAIEGLRARIDDLLKIVRDKDAVIAVQERQILGLQELQPPYNALARIRQLEDHVDTHAKERKIQGGVIRLMKRAIGEQKAHLRRLRAKLVHRARVQGSLRNDMHELLDDNGSLRDELKKLGGKLWRLEKNRAMHENKSPHAHDMSFVGTHPEGSKMTLAWDEAQHLADVTAYGVGFTKDGKRLDPKDVYLTPDQAVQRSLDRMQNDERYAVLYRDLQELLVKAFGGVKYPFPKRHREEGEL